MLDDIWDSITDGFDYFIHFEWLSDFWEAVTGVFENLGEFSMYGLIFAIIGMGFILFTNQWMLGSFTKLMKPAQGIFITILTYAVTGIVCYLLGKHFEE
jgi:MFS superfamily sulfate permease-like transporter